MIQEMFQFGKVSLTPVLHGITLVGETRNMLQLHSIPSYADSEDSPPLED
jgi:hypothetical protein